MGRSSTFRCPNFQQTSTHSHLHPYFSSHIYMFFNGHWKYVCFLYLIFLSISQTLWSLPQKPVGSSLSPSVLFFSKATKQQSVTKHQRQLLPILLPTRFLIPQQLHFSALILQISKHTSIRSFQPSTRYMTRAAPRFPPCSKLNQQLVWRAGCDAGRCIYRNIFDVTSFWSK